MNKLRNSMKDHKEVGRVFQGPNCLKLTTSLVNVSLNFQKLIPQICQ